MKKILAGCVASVGAVIILSPSLLALELTNCANLGLDSDPACKIAKENKLGSRKGDTNVAGQVINALLMVLAGISVAMIVIGGFQFTLSNGDPARVKKARMTILYAVVGLILAVASSVIVAYISNSLGK